MRRTGLRTFGTLLAWALIATACAGPTTPGTGTDRGGGQSGGAAKKTSVVLGVAAVIPALSWAYYGTSAGGAYSFAELYMQGLVTNSRTSSAPEPRIAAELPSVEKGTAQVLPDGQMRATWRIRSDARWADGTDLTARDFAFGFEVLKDRSNPLGGATSVVNIGPMVEALEVVDDKTFVMVWERPFYQFDAIGFLALQPIPVHVLRSIWDERNMDAVLNHPYWRGDYFQVGPYRPVRFEPQVEIVLQAVPTYFLGKPKIDIVTIKQFGDSNTLYAAVLAKAVDVTAEAALQPEQGADLKRAWDLSGEGNVYLGYGTSRGIFPQFDPSYQAEPAMLDPRARQALFTAVDRESWASSQLGGLVQNTAYSLLPPDHPVYEFTKDSLRGYPFDPAAAGRRLGELGWTRGPDGGLTHQADGRRFKVDIWTTQDNEAEAQILADMWKNVGLASALFIIPNAQVDNRELRQSYSGVEISARGYGDSILTRSECSTGAVPPRFAGSNRGHYCNPQMDQIIGNYRASLTRADQGRWITEIARYHAQELPMMQLYFNLSHPSVVRGLNVLADDFGGALMPGGYYGSYFRNAHLWDWT